MTDATTDDTVTGIRLLEVVDGPLASVTEVARVLAYSLTVRLGGVPTTVYILLHVARRIRYREAGHVEGSEKASLESACRQDEGLHHQAHRQQATSFR